jgi:hypothetical protein
MTRRSSRPFHAPANVDLGKTRSQFLFARDQACAHAAAAEYLRMRNTVRRAGGATAEGAHASSGGTD